MALNRSLYGGSAWVMVVILCLFSYAEGKRFTLYDDTVKPHTVCGLLDADITIVLTAMDGDKELNMTHVTTNSSEVHVSGTCGLDLVLNWPNYVAWHATRIGFSDKPMIELSVAFLPEDLFGHIGKCPDIALYEGRKHAQLQNEHSSFNCPQEYAEYYVSDLESENITFKVLVVIHDIQVQLVNLEDDTFSPPGPECQYANKDSPFPTVPTIPRSWKPFWRRRWPLVVFFTVALACLLIGVGVWKLIRRRQGRRQGTTRLYN